MLGASHPGTDLAREAGRGAKGTGGGAGPWDGVSQRGELPSRERKRRLHPFVSVGRTRTLSFPVVPSEPVPGHHGPSLHWSLELGGAPRSRAHAAWTVLRRWTAVLY